MLVTELLHPGWKNGAELEAHRRGGGRRRAPAELLGRQLLGDITPLDHCREQLAHRAEPQNRVGAAISLRTCMRILPRRFHPEPPHRGHVQIPQ